VISFETARDGFILTVEGRRVLRHTRKAPCVELASAEHRVRQNRGSFILKTGRAVPKKLGDFELRYRGADRTVVDFGGLLLMTVTYEGGVLRLAFSSKDRSLDHFRIRLGAHPKERIYGCGEQYSKLDLKGRRVPLWVGEKGIGRGKDLISLAADLWAGAGGDWHTTYFPAPVYVSSMNYWAVVDTAAHTTFTFGKRLTAVECWGLPESIAMGFGREMPKIMSALSTELGRQSSPPDWVYDGAWLGVQGGMDSVMKKLDAAVGAGAAVGAVWVQDWCGKRETSFGSQLNWNWSCDRSLYPDLEGGIRNLGERGIRFLGYVNCFLATDGEQYREASSRGYCVRKGDGSDYLVKLTSFPAAMLDAGMSGWMADFGEYLPADAVLHSGEDASLAHNRWPVLWASLNREAIAEWSVAGTTGPAGRPRSARDIVFFVRSGWLGSSSETRAVWAGDQLVNFSRNDGLPSVIPASLSMGFSGIAFWHSDIGGYMTVAWLKRSPRCLARWMEMSAFSPAFRTHESNRPDRNVQFWSDPAMLALLARSSEIFAALKPYHRAVTEEYRLVGLPPIRHPFIHYEGDGDLHSHPYQYMYGRDILVAPTLDEKSRSTNLRLPEDEWIHLWSSRHFAGGDLTIETPFGYPAVFYREASAFASLFDAIRRTVRKV
jgi:alpha-glucosidase